jgi:hypothetical protein
LLLDQKSPGMIAEVAALPREQNDPALSSHVPAGIKLETLAYSLPTSATISSEMFTLE